MNIPLKNAMLCWDTTSMKAAVVRHPDEIGASRSFRFSTGACWVQKWPNMSEEEKLLMLMFDAWQAIIRDGMPAEEMHRALCAIPEFSASLAADVPGSSAASMWG